MTDWSIDEPDLETPALDDLLTQREEALQRAYQLGLLHGINAQSMAQVKYEILPFEDYGWSLDAEDRDD